MAIQGAIPVRFDDVFPAGAFVLDVAPVQEFGGKVAGKQARDKITGEPVWAVTVIDADPQARQKQAKVKIAAPVCPVLPPEVGGLPFRPVFFEGLTAMPWVEYTNGKDTEGRDRARVSYSYRATGMRAPSASAGGSKPSAKAA